MNRRPLFTAIALASAMLSTNSLAQDKPIRIATEGAYAPWNFTVAGGKLEGFEIDLANDLCTRMKSRCEIVAQDWDGMIPALNAGKIDVIMAAMSVTEERKKALAFSDIYAPTSSTFIAAKSEALAALPERGILVNLDKNGPDAERLIQELRGVLKGKIIGVQGSTTNTNFIQKYFADAVQIREYKTTEAHDLDLSSGRIDAVFATITVAKATLEKPDLADFRTSGPIFSGGVFGPGVAAAMRQSDTSLLGTYNAALKSAIADGTLGKLTTKWFGADLTPK
ncbi:transporter substrate-binding domain-containing protein [Microvirga sp. M2]|uniref:transporter substrate-binding domain-containing protein n=1 Tax=Microvirga sp. M2 TaxID=3073270 RepID=UPI0039C47126